ncbi:hypothetical protein A2U01_0115183, partial [Trifolium medium]|nr:hypothetical protein [Trifolium medium]
ENFVVEKFSDESGECDDEELVDVDSDDEKEDESEENETSDEDFRVDEDDDDDDDGKVEEGEEGLEKLW